MGGRRERRAQCSAMGASVRPSKGPKVPVSRLAVHLVLGKEKIKPPSPYFYLRRKRRLQPVQHRQRRRRRGQPSSLSLSPFPLIRRRLEEERRHAAEAPQGVQAGAELLGA